MVTKEHNATAGISHENGRHYMPRSIFEDATCSQHLLELSAAYPILDMVVTPEHVTDYNGREYVLEDDILQMIQVPDFIQDQYPDRVHDHQLSRLHAALTLWIWKNNGEPPQKIPTDGGMKLAIPVDKFVDFAWYHHGLAGGVDNKLPILQTSISFVQPSVTTVAPLADADMSNSSIPDKPKKPKRGRKPREKSPAIKSDDFEDEDEGDLPTEEPGSVEFSPDESDDSDDLDDYTDGVLLLHEVFRTGEEEEDVDWELTEDEEDYLSLVPIDDPVGIYLRQMSQEPLLTSDEEVALAKRIEAIQDVVTVLSPKLTGPQIIALTKQRELGIKNEMIRQHIIRLKLTNKDELFSVIDDVQAAREHMTRANTRLVVSIARRYMEGRLAFLDLIQEGNIGLMKAVDRFDRNRGYRFSTYATWWIRQSISRSLAGTDRTIRIPVHMSDKIRHMYRTARMMEQSLGRPPTVEELAVELNSTPKKIDKLFRASWDPISLQRPAGEEGDSEFGDFIEDEDAERSFDAVSYKLLRRQVAEVLHKLSPRYAEILRLRFGIKEIGAEDEDEPGEEHTLEQIGNMFGITRERVRQLEKEAFRRVRQYNTSQPLKDLFDSFISSD